jgi:hypothetical protein
MQAEAAFVNERRPLEIESQNKPPKLGVLRFFPNG